MYDKPTFTHLILSGGAAKGFMYMGALRYLQQEGYYKTIKDIYTTSIGSLFGLLFALNISMGDIEKEFKEYISEEKNNKICDINIIEFITEYGIVEPDKNPIFIGLKNILKKNNYENYTFLDLAKNKGINLNMKAIHYNTLQLFTFNLDNSPNVLLIDAAIASATLPFFSKPYKIGNELYIDGGFAENIPIVIDNTINKDNVLILSCCFNLKESCKIYDNSNIINYFINLLNVVSCNINTQILLKKEYKHFVSFINSPINFLPMIIDNISIISVLTIENIDDSIIKGYEEIYNHFNKIDNIDKIE